MTDRQGGLAVLVSLDAPEREAALAAFYERFEDEPLVIDKWFALQAAAQRDDTLDEVERLASHPAFTMHNPTLLSSYPSFRRKPSPRSSRAKSVRVCRRDCCNPCVQPDDNVFRFVACLSRMRTIASPCASWR